MLIQLLFANTGHFALNVFSAFVFFAVGLLYFDSWQVNRHKNTPLLRSVGFFLLAIATALHATEIEISSLVLLMQVLKITGLIIILFSLIKEPVLHAPRKLKAAIALPLALPAISASLIPLSAGLTWLIAAAYFRQATEGLEKHAEALIDQLLWWIRALKTARTETKA